MRICTQTDHITTLHGVLTVSGVAAALASLLNVSCQTLAHVQDIKAFVESDPYMINGLVKDWCALGQHSQLHDNPLSTPHLVSMRYSALPRSVWCSSVSVVQ